VFIVGQRWVPETSADRRHTRPDPGNGIEARWAGPVEHTHFVGAKVLSVR
jgi:hypothetical protein